MWTVLLISFVKHFDIYRMKSAIYKAGIIISNILIDILGTLNSGAHVHTTQLETVPVLKALHSKEIKAGRGIRGRERLSN